jgi:hypothetical protein
MTENGPTSTQEVIPQKMENIDLIDFAAVTAVTLFVLFIFLITQVTFGITLLGIILIGIIHGSFFYVKLSPPTEGICKQIAGYWTKAKEFIVTKVFAKI